MKMAITSRKRSAVNRVKLEDFDDQMIDGKNLTQSPVASSQKRSVSRKVQDSVAKTQQSKNSLPAESSQLNGLFQQGPDDVDELIVNKKKVNEVRNWLRRRINEEENNKCLLITGPAGCGKSSTVRLLCDDLDIELLEFDLEQKINIIENYNGESTFYNEAQIHLFREFILESQSKSLVTCSRTRKLIIIKELPHVLISDPKLLFNFLQETIPALKVFLVFALTMIDTSWELSPRRLFPETLLQQLNIEHIKFNPITQTAMTKVVNSWLESLGTPKNLKFTKNIVEKAGGDLRSALSLIQMCCVDKKFVNLDFLCAVDSPLDVFHYIGKILYAKRLETSNTKWKAAEERLKPNVKIEYRREFPPKEDLNVLARSSTISNYALVDFIIEHEPYFCQNPRILSRIYDDICQTMVFSSPFPLQINPVVNDINRQITIRSVVFNNYKANRMVQNSLYKFKKSSAGEMRRRRAGLMTDLNSIYPSASLVDTTTFLIPLLSKVNSYITEDQVRLCETIDSRVKIDPRRMQVNKLCRPLFDICNDSD